MSMYKRMQQNRRDEADAQPRKVHRTDALSRFQTDQPGAKPTARRKISKTASQSLALGVITAVRSDRKIAEDEGAAWWESATPVPVPAPALHALDCSDGEGYEEIVCYGMVCIIFLAMQ
jgi:hypothetical protein